MGGNNKDGNDEARRVVTTEIDPCLMWRIIGNNSSCYLELFRCSYSNTFMVHTDYKVNNPKIMLTLFLLMRPPKKVIC